MTDTAKLIELAKAAMSPIWGDNTLPEGYMANTDYDHLCERRCGNEWCVESCYEVRGRLLKEKSIAHFIAALSPGVTDALGWESAQPSHRIQPSGGAWRAVIDQIHPNFKSPPRWQVTTGAPRPGGHAGLGPRICSVAIREKYHWLGTSCTVGKAEYEWANAAHINKFNPEFVLRQLE
jgi:hypothetical protein